MNNLKFNKSFEALYAISMKMADECIMNKPMEARFAKLEEEFNEVMEAYTYLQFFEGTNQEIINGKHHADHIKDVKCELADLLFVLLHIGHRLGISAFELLHTASSKMLNRMADQNYIAKI